MPACARVGQEGIVDIQTPPAGVAITGPGIPSVTVNGFTIAVVGDAIPAHVVTTPTPPPHPASVISAGSGTVTAGGIAVARVGDPTTDLVGSTLVTLPAAIVSDVIVG